MPNLTTPFLDLKGEDINEDMDNVQEWSMSLIDELKHILCNLDSGNVIEAGSVKAQNIDCTKARIKGAQIQSLTADKLSAGTIDAGQITIKSKDKNGGEMNLTGEQFLIEANNGSCFIGADGGKMLFILQSSDGKQGVYMTEQGKILMTGEFATGRDGEARTVINENGIQSYNDQNQKHGLWSNPQWSDFTMYYQDKKIFEIVNGNPDDNGGNYSLYLGGQHVIIVDDKGNINFSVEGVTGEFKDADGRTVNVKGGVITDIR